MDDFLNALREPPRPEFARELYERLQQAERKRRRVAVLTRAAGMLAAGMSVVVALSMGQALRGTAQPQQVKAAQQSPLVVALLMPGAQEKAAPVFLPAVDPAAEAIDVSLKVPPTPVLHHH